MRQRGRRGILHWTISFMMVLGLMFALSTAVWASDEIGVGSTWYVGDSINMKDYYVAYDDTRPDTKRLCANYPATVPSPAYQTESDGLWTFAGMMKTESLYPKLYLKKPADRTASDIPLGFKIKSGNGTEESPYRFELVYHTHDQHTFFKWRDPDHPLPNEAGTYHLIEDVTITDTWTIPENTTINLCLNGHRILLNTTRNVPVIKIPNTSTLNLYDCSDDELFCQFANWSINWFSHETPSDGLVQHLNEQGVGTIKITGGCITHGNDSGVLNQGTFNMYGGNIVSNSATSGGGVRNEGTFNMHGGKICYNKSRYAGGVHVTESGTMKMSGGEIFDNYADSEDGDIDHKGRGGGICRDVDGEVNIDGGSIRDNEAKSSGGGIYLMYGTLDINGGSIKDNKSEDSGGGIYLRGGTLSVNGGSITGNKTKYYGGGIYYAGSDSGNFGTFNISGGLDVSGNKQGTSADTDSNTYLGSETIINVTDTLTNTEPIGISIVSARVFTSGLKGKGDKSNFKIENHSEWGLALTSDGEAKASALRSVTINTTGNGSITVKDGETEISSGTKVPEDTVLKVNAVASDGYYISEGPTVTAGGSDIQLEDGKFTVPANDVTISVTFTKVEKEPTPTAAFTADGPASGKLTGVQAGMKYTLDGETWTDIDSDSDLALTDLNNAPYVILVVKKGNPPSTIDSNLKIIMILKAAKPNLTVTQPDANHEKGTIATTTEHEYSSDNGETWTDCVENQQLDPGTYYVRVKAGGSVLASDAQSFSIAAPGHVAEPVFDPEPGTYEKTQNVTISCNTADANIYYTTDGSEPTTSSTKYTDVVPVTKTTTIKASAVKAGMINSEVATAEYTITEPAPEFAVVVNNGTGGGNYAKGVTVTIKADAPATGKKFKEWTTEDGLTFADLTAAETTFKMPAKAVTVTATYEDAPSGGDTPSGGGDTPSGGGDTPSGGGDGGSADDAVQQIVDKINALAEPYDEAKVKELREAYDKLTPEQKADKRLTDELMKKLTDAEAAVASGKDKAAAANVSELIAALPDDPAKAGEDQVAGAVAAYKALSESAKVLITDVELQKLQTAMGYPATTMQTTLTSVKTKKGKKAIIKWEKSEAADGYQLFYKAKGVKAKKVDINSADTLKTKVKKLKPGKKYIFKVRTYKQVEYLATGEMTSVYGKWSNIKKAKTKK